jgi:hypothetical protein
LIDNGTQKVAILVNQNQRGIQAQFTLDGTPWYLKLQAESISTVLLTK